LFLQFSTELSRCDPTFFEDDQFHEATRLIELELQLLRSDEDPKLKDPTSYSVDLRYPRLHFAGSSRGLSGHQALIKGHVDRYWDGTIRWTFVRDHLPSPLASHADKVSWISSLSMIIRQNGCEFFCHREIIYLLTGHFSRFNGVQLGNACSEAGVVGTWTGTAHEPGVAAVFFFSQ
jgi:hypothetical protein